MTCGIFGYGSVLPSPLPYAPPAQQNPTIVYVGTGYFTNEEAPFADDEDWIAVLPREGVRGGGNVGLFGGRHGRIIGGHMAGGSLVVGNVTGSMFIEGVRWLMDAERDCLGVYGKPGSTPNWYFQNLYFGNVQGSFAGVHGDMIQWYDGGPVGGNVYMHNITGDANYQGLKIDVYQAVEPVGEFRLSNINLRGRAGTPILYFLRNNDDVGDGLYPVPTTIENCYAEAAEGQNFQSTAWPAPGQTINGQDAGNFINSDGSLSFPAALHISGNIKPGQPTGGDFCPSSAGVGYRSPGYR